MKQLKKEKEHFEYLVNELDKQINILKMHRKELRRKMKRKVI